MKIAVGLFHFNPHWNLDPRSAHRHCTEALIPFLNTVRQHPDWHVTMEMSGSGLEFVHNSYPGAMRLLRELVHSKRVELISSLYTPNIWVAFPRRDLLKSIELNQQCLAKLDIPWSRIFFAQEAFFGEGVTTLAEFFDVGVCRDDYLAYHYNVPFVNPCLMRNGLKVVAASNHLLSELRHHLKTDSEFAGRNGLSYCHIKHLEQTSTLNDPSSFPASRGMSKDTEWLWYHCGDGNHFGCIYKPDDLERCYHDPVWSSLCTRQLESYADRGYRLGTIREFMEGLDYSEAFELPPLVEGAWNPGQSNGLFCWMGRNDTVAENDAGVLATIAHAHKRLIAAERAVNGLSTPPDGSKLDQAWATLLHAQISDSLGWNAGPQAVQQSLRAADHASMLADQVLDNLGQHDVHDIRERSVRPLDGHDEARPVAWPEPELFGADGGGDYTSLNDCVRLYEYRFKAVDSRCGIRFPFTMPELVFCPSAMETAPVRIAMELFHSDVQTLPLANGMIQIADHIFVVKDTQFVHVCAIVERRQNKVEFAVQGASPQRSYTWRFYVVSGTLECATNFANAVNVVDENTQ